MPVRTFLPLGNLPKPFIFEAKLTSIVLSSMGCTFVFLTLVFCHSPQKVSRLTPSGMSIAKTPLSLLGFSFRMQQFYTVAFRLSTVYDDDPKITTTPSNISFRITKIFATSPVSEPDHVSRENKLD
jgi:hypothetical protein